MSGPPSSPERGVVVIGVGSPSGDDAAGLEVAARLVPMAPPGVEVVLVRGDATVLVDRWDGVPVAYLVDAVRSGAPAGSIHETDLLAGEPLSPALALSSHGIGVDEAVRLGRALGKLPGRLALIGIEAFDTGPGPKLSPEVERAVATVVAGLLDRLARTANPSPPQPLERYGRALGA